MDRLVALQRTIEGGADPDRNASFVDRLCVTWVSNVCHLDFYGDPNGQSFFDLLDVLTATDVADVVTSIDLRGPDVEAQMVHGTGT